MNDRFFPFPDPREQARRRRGYPAGRYPGRGYPAAWPGFDPATWAGYGLPAWPGGAEPRPGSQPDQGQVGPTPGQPSTGPEVPQRIAVRPGEAARPQPQAEPAAETSPAPAAPASAAASTGAAGSAAGSGAALEARLRELEAENAELRRQLEAARTESEERLDQVQRLRADHVNYRRRMEGERSDERRQANALLLIKLLPVLDDLERAMDTVNPELAGLNWVQGIGHITRKLESTLQAEGLTRLDALGQPFDPTQHEAVLREETDDEHVGRVLSVLQHGYRLHDRVIRPAMVKVGVPRQTPSHATGAGDEHQRTTTDNR